MEFSDVQLSQLREEFAGVYDGLLRVHHEFAKYVFKNVETHEYVFHGLLRRMDIMHRCIQNVYALCQPEGVQGLGRDGVVDATINVQCFVFNTYGCIDNAAWIFVKETGIHVGKNSQVSFDKPEIKSHMSSAFLKYFQGLHMWLKYLKDFRHAMAHRIPLYIPPFCLDDCEAEQFVGIQGKIDADISGGVYSAVDELQGQQDKLGRFVPVFAQSFKDESRCVVFHAQVIAYWNTVVELSLKLLDELRSGPLQGTKVQAD